MQASGITHFEVLLLLLLSLVTVLAVAAKRIQIPYPIVLVIGGLLLGFVPHVPRPHLAPNVVFLVFLPPLLFSASFQISWRDFRGNLVSIVVLAFGLVGFTIWGCGLFTKSVFPGFSWPLGLVLGSVIATTDAIAATATAKRLGLPRRITDLLEAESLVNDGSGLLALKFTAAIVVSGVTPSFAAGSLQLLYLIAGAVAVGLVAGVVVRYVQRLISDAPIEITITLVAPYVTYLCAEAAHCSGVLATIACGLYLGRHRSLFFSLEARIEASAFWHTLDFILNGLVFLLLGLQLPEILADIRGLSLHTVIIDGALFSGVVIVLRLLWVYPGAWFSTQFKRSILRVAAEQPPGREVFLVGWAGMRGVLALAAAISLPERLQNGAPFPQRSLLIFLTFCVILATLVFQGLTMPALIRRLGLAGLGRSRDEEAQARRQMIEAALLFLREQGQSDPIFAEDAKALESYYERELHMVGTPTSVVEQTSRGQAERRRELGRELRAVERRVLLRLRDEDKIHDDVLRTLEREIDLLDARFSAVD
jgi:monovalent cation/hydrogen antiporter